MTSRAAIVVVFLGGCATSEAAVPSVVSEESMPTEPSRDGSGSQETEAPRQAEDGGDRDAGSDNAPPPACSPDGTVFAVTAFTASEYVIDGEPDPQLVLCRGRTYTFRVDAPFHPFFVKTEPTLGTGETFDLGVTGNGLEIGDVVFAVPAGAPALLHYICESHDAMQGEIVIRD